MKKHFLNPIKDFFSFSQKEMNGFVVMVIVMLVAISSVIIYDILSSEPVSVDPNEAKVLDSLLSEINKSKVVESQISYPSSPEIEKQELFHFDPNKATVQQFTQLGFKPYLAERIAKYRSKRGKFKVKSDLKKIYGLPEFLYATLEPYIDLPEIAIEETKTTFTKPLPDNVSPSKQKQDLNTADSIALEKVYGIGFKLAARIIKYRNKLGGFVNMSQLKEVYGLDSVAIQALEMKFLIADDFQPVKINLNTDNFELLKSHPYMGYQKAKLIVNFRKQHGTYHTIDQLKEIQTISAEDIQKLKPYLGF